MPFIAVPRIATPPSGNDTTVPSRAQFAAVLTCSGILGFLAGIIWQPTWQDAVEPAQVLAGLVTYPPDSPVYLYSTRTWTVLHQACAGLLTAGLSERTVSLLVSGLMGMVSLQALGTLVLALSGDVLLAIVSPFFVVLTRTASGGVTYPIVLLGVPWTYGIIGLSYALLVLALVGAGRTRCAALLLGFAPAVHVTIGIWMIVVTATAAAFDSTLRGSMRAAAPWLLAGAGAALASLALHVLHQTTPAAALPSLSSLGLHWDEHRQQFALLGPRALTAYFAAALPALWLWRFAADVPAHVRPLLRLLVVSTVVGGVFSISYWMVPPDVPNVVATFMPSRLLNVSCMACMALLLGLTPRYASSPEVRGALVVMVVGLVTFALLRPDDDGTIQQVVGWSAMALYAAILAIAADRQRRGHPHGMGITWRETRIRPFAIGVIIAALAGVAAAAAREFGSSLDTRFADRTSDHVLAAAARRPGLLLTSGNQHGIQSSTRRAVLLDGAALDAQAYVPEVASETDRILRRVYGIDLSEVRRLRRGYLEDDHGKALWQSRSTDKWRDIAREFAVADILTPAGWKLQLPVVASNPHFVLYAIPD